MSNRIRRSSAVRRTRSQSRQIPVYILGPNMRESDTHYNIQVLLNHINKNAPTDLKIEHEYRIEENNITDIADFVEDMFDQIFKDTELAVKPSVVRGLSNPIRRCFLSKRTKSGFILKCIVEEAHIFMGRPLIEQIAKSIKAVIAKATSLIMEAGSSYINNNLFIEELLDDMDEFDRSYNPLDIAHIIKLFIYYVYTYNTKMKLACSQRLRDNCEDPCEWDGRCMYAPDIC